MAKSADKRRLRQYLIDERVILNVLGNWRRKTHVALPVADNVPEGYEVVAFRFDDRRWALAMLVTHASFDEVPPGEEVPFHGFALWREEVISVQPMERLWRLWAEQAEWSQRTFGDDISRGPVGPLKHLAREAMEAAENTSDHSEFADCFLLVLDAARRAGLSLGDLVDEAAQKLVVNQGRTWPSPTTSDEPVFHTKVTPA